MYSLGKDSGLDPVAGWWQSLLSYWRAELKLGNLVLTFHTPIFPRCTRLFGLGPHPGGLPFLARPKPLSRAFGDDEDGRARA